MTSELPTRVPRFFAVLVVAAAIGGAIWPLFLGQRFAFRDVNHFYLPLYDYVAERTASQWLPMWNPLDHNGMPLIGESSTAVLYPVRFVVYSLVGGEQAMNVYLAIHLLLGAACAAVLAKRVGCRMVGIAIAAMVYPLSGSVFSLVCNPPFLVGAAWLPLLLACVWGREGQGGEPRSDAQGFFEKNVSLRIGVGAIAFAMMILGGDPQAAFHAGLISLFIILWTQERRRSLRVLAVATALGLGMASLQLAASYDWSRQSSRTDSSVYRTDTYDFSLGPWHSMELLTPRPFGEPFPINRRLSKLIPGDGRMWTPTIYAGFLAGLALLTRLGRPRHLLRDPWTLLAVVALMMSFGHFTALWLLQQFGLWQEVSSSVGGPYWVLSRLVPPYRAFRYPVKWLPVFTIATAMIAARWGDAFTKRDQTQDSAERIQQWVLLGVALTHLLVGMVLLQTGWLQRVASDTIANLGDEYYGPLDVAGGIRLSMGSWAWTAALVGVLIWLLPRRRASGSDMQVSTLCGRARVMLLLVLVAVDLSLSARAIFPTISIAESNRIYADRIGDSTMLFPSGPRDEPRRWLRTQSGSWPRVWSESHSKDRPLESAVSERLAFLGRWHLAERQAVFNSMVSIQSATYKRFWRSLNRQLSKATDEERERFWVAAKRWLSLPARVHTDAARIADIDGLQLVYVDWVISDPLPNIRVSGSWRGTRTVDELVTELIAGTVPLPSFEWEHTDRLVDTDKRLTKPRLEVLHRSAERLEIQIDTESPVVVERSVFQDGNWRAERVSEDGRVQSAQVLPSSLFHQAVVIPDSGRWRVTFRYQPWWRDGAIGVTLVSALASLGLVFRGFLALRRVSGISTERP
ncbi:MAG: hypothetical protein AAFV88_12760 [Planctomycetota bacterium]